jgi:hypothetical protein
MDPAIEASQLVATVFANGPDNDPFTSFKGFLNSHMVSFRSARILKTASAFDPLVVIEYSFAFESNASSNLSALQKAAYEWGKTVNVDISIQRDDVFRRYKRLVVFDMDSTLIKQEVIDEIALYLDPINPEKKVGKKVAVLSPVERLLNLGNHGIGNAGTHRFSRVVTTEGGSPLWNANYGLRCYSKDISVSRWRQGIMLTIEEIGVQTCRCQRRIRAPSQIRSSRTRVGLCFRQYCIFSAIDVTDCRWKLPKMGPY